MKTSLRFALIFVISAICLFFQYTQALATTLTAVGGLAFGRNTGMNEIKTPSPLLGAEYTMDLLPRLQIGGFFDHNTLSFRNGPNGSLRFIGALLRIYLGKLNGSSPFVDAKAGIGQMQQDELSSTTQLGYGIGAGYRLALSKVISLSPKFDARFLPASTGTDTSRKVYFDGALLFSIRI